jgi:dCMP deaminase
MPNAAKLDKLYMDIAGRIGQMSHARRKKVGAVLVSNDNIISMGWNGTAAGDDNNCEEYDADRDELVTRPEVLHAESNCLMKLIASGGQSSKGSTLYVTLSPCTECAKLIKQAKISRVVYGEAYRDPKGIGWLSRHGVKVDYLANED